MNYFYHQAGQQDNEKWRAVPENKLGDIKGAMFVTVLGIDSPVTDSATKEQLADIKYIGPMYWDFDSENAWDTAKSVNELVTHLIDEMEVREQDIALYASGGKGFHIFVPQQVFMIKPVPMVNLPLIYKEMAYELAKEHMDFRVYTARRGRMIRQANVLRPNGLYKVRILRAELQALASLPPDEAKAEYARLCSAPRMDPPVTDPETATEMLALFDACKSKVTKVRAKAKKRKPVKLPANLPSFDALLRGEGIDSEAGFHQIALQVAITAHQRGLSQKDLLSAAAGLCENHSSDSSRYNTPSKRSAELARMWDYTEDNPCYEYSGAAVASLLTHNAPDLRGLEVDADELDIVVPEEGEGNEFDHAGVILTRRGMFMQTEEGPKQLSAMAFENVTELVSVDTNRVSVLQADVVVSGVRKGAAVLDLESFNSVAKFNSLTMPHGQSFSGTDVQARGVYMRLVEKARKNQKRMYCVGREGLDVISMPFHEDEELRKPFMVWSDVESVTPEPRIADKNLIFKFVGFPSERGQFECDLSKAPQLAQYLRDGSENVERFTSTLKSLLSCQKPGYIGKLVGWMVACHYRMLFHKVYDKFPLLHINGAAGSGKCLAKGTPVLMVDGTTRKVEDVKVGEYLISPYGVKQEVLSTCTGKELMYEVTPVKGAPYTVNASHILSLKRSNQGSVKLGNGRVIPAEVDVLNINVEEYYANEAKLNKMFKGWRNESELEFHNDFSELPVDPYWLGLWLGDGNSTDVAIYKPESCIVDWLRGYATRLGMELKRYGAEGKCPGWAITRGNVAAAGRRPNLLRDYVMTHQKVKHIPDAYKFGPVAVRKQVLAGLLDTDGSLANGGFDWISKSETLAEDLAFICRSLGLAAYVAKCRKGIKSTGFVGTYWRVSISGDCSVIPTLDKKADPRNQIKRVTVTGIKVKPVGEGDYYGFQISGDHLFMLGDFTVTHNTETTKLISHLHYYNTEPKMVTPSSTFFPIQYAAAGSCSIPLIIDEFKPQDMQGQMHDKFRLLFRDAYNCREMARGGGTRENSDYRAIHAINLSAPICFIAEAAESESAVMERVVLLTMVKPAAIEATKYLRHFEYVKTNKDILSMIGHYMSASLVRRYSVDMLKEDFDPVYEEARLQLMLQPGEEDTLSREEVERKSNAKERTVFNYAVARFGLLKLKNFVMKAAPDVELDALFTEALNDSYDSGSTQSHTQPEWLKVLNEFVHMSRLAPDSQAYLQEGIDFAYVEEGGVDCIEIYTASCYYKYRVYVRGMGSKPLFPSSAAFAHAVDNLPSVKAKNQSHVLQPSTGVHILSLSELRAAGFIPPLSK